MRLSILFSFVLWMTPSYVVVTSCAKNGIDDRRSDDVKNTIVIHAGERKQVIKNFGASDAWTCQFVGLWPDEKRNQVADWLFSTENDNTGKPKGIGLSLWRFNIGAGSATQNNITDAWRRTEGFLKDDMAYDWSRQAGQRWFMQAAKQRGVLEFLGFSNSPPVQLTKNGKAYSGNGTEANIPPEKYLAFAKFLIDVSIHMREEGIPFNYLSPFNEPQWDWTGNGQEGSPYKNTEIFAITKILDSLLVKQKLNLKLQIAEAGKLNYLYEKADKPTRGEQINEFFDTKSPLYVGKLTTVDRMISGHSYFTSAPAETMNSVRMKVAEAIKKASVPIEFHQSEYCILGDQEEIPGGGKETGMDPALYVARLIHHDLTVANAAAWQWWLAVTAYDYKDGLIYVDKNKADGKVEDTKLLWALGNYSRFIRPGAERISLTSDNLNVNNPKGIMASSFIDKQQKQVIMVVINYGNAALSFLLDAEGVEVEAWQPYITGSAEEQDLYPLQKLAADEKVTIPARSIITLVGQIQ